MRKSQDVTNAEDQFTSAYSQNLPVSAEEYVRALHLISCSVPTPTGNATKLKCRKYKHMLLRLASSVQMRSAAHHSSRSKGSKRTGIKNQCSFGMLADDCSATEIISGTVKVCLKCSASNIYLNAFNRAMMLRYKSNHDLQLLFGKRECIAFYYVVG